MHFDDHVRGRESWPIAILRAGREFKLQLPNPNRLKLSSPTHMCAFLDLNTYRYVAFKASQLTVIPHGDHDSLLVKHQNDNHLWQNVVFLSFPKNEYVQSIKEQQQQSQNALDVLFCFRFCVVVFLFVCSFLFFFWWNLFDQSVNFNQEKDNKNRFCR